MLDFHLQLYQFQRDQDQAGRECEPRTMRESVARVSDASLPTTSTESSSTPSPPTSSIGSMNGSLPDNDKGAIYRRRQQHGHSGVLLSCSEVLRKIQISRAGLDFLAQLRVNAGTTLVHDLGILETPTCMSKIRIIRVIRVIRVWIQGQVLSTSIRTKQRHCHLGVKQMEITYYHVWVGFTGEPILNSEHVAHDAREIWLIFYSSPYRSS